MRRIDGRALLQASEVFTCPRCGAELVGFPGFPPPEACDACLRPALLVLSRLEFAEVPRSYRAHAVAGRSAWSQYFRRRWPRAATLGPQILYFWGPTGTGKTTAAAVLLAEAIAGGQGALWIDGVEIRSAAKRDFGSSGPGALDRALAASVAVYDEPLAGVVSDWAMSDVAYRIIHGRLSAGRVTIVTGQLGPEDLSVEKLYPPPLVSRLLSGARVPFNGEDARLRVEGGA